MATYNGARYVEKQIQSILPQLRMDDELIISDDSSTDDTVRIIAGIPDPRIKLHTNSRFRDPIKNFQNALQFARGDYIFLSDQDDVWMKDKYGDMLSLLNHYDLVVSDSVVVDDDLNPIHPSFFSYLKSGKGVIKNIIKSSYYGSCMAFTKQIANLSVPFPETKEIGHDLWIGLVAEMVGKVVFYHKPLLLYRRHDSAFTSTGLLGSNRTAFQKLNGRFTMVKEVVKFYTKYKCYGKGARVDHYSDV